MKCDIIIPIWNQLEFTRDCIEHLVRNTLYPHRLILIDNGSDHQTKEYLENLKNDKSLEVILIRNEENLGFIKAVNQGLRASDAPYICILNNDTLPAPGWLEAMVEFAEEHKDVGLINPQCGGHENIPIDIYARTLAKHKGEYMEMNQCQGWCMLVRRELIDKIGILDESYGIGGYDDTDYSMRVHLAGYRCVAIKNSYVYHRLHGSFNKSGDRQDWVDRNRKIYYDKWGKHLRIGIALSLEDPDDETMSRVVRFAYGMAREWSWIHIWLNCDRDKRTIRDSFSRALTGSGLTPHQNIKLDCFDLPQPIFNFVLSGKLIERLRGRRKDKAFDAVILFDKDAARLVQAAANLAGAAIYRFDLGEDRADWLEKGRVAALSIKKYRKRENAGLAV